MNYEETLVEWSKKAYGNEPKRKIADIIVYEAADCLRDCIRLEDYPQDKELYTKLLGVSLGDVLAMSQLLCSMAQLDFAKVYNDGCQRAIERCKEKLEGRSGF